MPLRYRRAHCRARRAAILLGLTGLAAMACMPASVAADEGKFEYQVKALFLLRIAQFTDWPGKPAHRAEDPFIIGVLGDDPFGSTLDETVVGERIAGRPVVVRRFAAPTGLATSDLLFVAGSHRSAIERVLEQLSGSSTLTVADFEGFVGRGGAVEFFVDQGRVRFRIDRSAAQAAGLSLSSQLLRAAVAVRED